VKSHVRFLAAVFFLLLATPVFYAAGQSTPPPLPPPAPTCGIVVNPSTITVGGSVEVRWTSTNATQGSITHVGEVPPSGAVNLLPSSAARTTFAGTFVGPNGTTTCSASVSVSIANGGAGGIYSGGGMYSEGGIYSGGEIYEIPPYTINPSSFSTQPSNNTFSQTPNTVGSSANGGGGISSFLVPCGYADPGSPDTYFENSTKCNICHLGQMSQNIVNFLLMVAIPISAGLFAWAGILYFTAVAKPAQTAKAKKIFSSVFIGFVIALSGYLIVQTLLNAILNPSFSTGQWRWSSLQCDGNRPRSSTIKEIFRGLFMPTGNSGINSGGGGIGGTGGTQTVSARNLSGGEVSVSFPTNTTDASLQAGYTAAQAYSSQINSACSQFGSNLPDCQVRVAAMIAVESGGRNGLTSSMGAQGLMQLLPGTAQSMGFTCSLSDPQCNINAGTKYMSQMYSTFRGNDANMIAAYNAGPGNGRNPNGTLQAFAPSQNCAGYAAWQCSTNPGGFTQTQGHVAKVCRLVSLNGQGCK